MPLHTKVCFQSAKQNTLVTLEQLIVHSFSRIRECDLRHTIRHNVIIILIFRIPIKKKIIIIISQANLADIFCIYNFIRTTSGVTKSYGTVTKLVRYEPFLGISSRR